MSEPHRKRPVVRVRTQEPDESGFDVWLPLLVAIAAAIFMVWQAKAAELPEPTAAPRPIYDASLFDAYATGAAPDTGNLLPGAVEMAPLPVIAVAPPEPVAPLPKPVMASLFVLPVHGPADPLMTISFDMIRAAAAITILLMLVGSLVALSRTWRRLEPVSPQIAQAILR